ncbi:cytosine-purine permease [Dendrothele bispora CBS 962.96]|uniref:Cytosine-purine permease n=1 Tax=Dendrothele bispora (strain CBS 962.96) TaxID=1314807 RepID=A0A4S8MRG0_DENBC|nr:cytosine-purine permease [Dendrothele bispora CBS 962.96]
MDEKNAPAETMDTPELSGSESHKARPERRLVKRVLLWGVEIHGIAPTSVEERVDTRLYQMFTVWFSAILNLTALSAGALGPVVWGLGLRDSVIILIIADIIGCLFPAYCVVFGPKLGVRTMVLTRFSFGYFGTALPSLLSVVSQGGWLIINSVIGGQVLAATSTSNRIDDTVGIVIIVLITFVITFFGYKVLHRFEMYIWIPNTVLFIAMLGVGGRNLSARPSLPEPAASALISYGTTIYAANLTWCTSAADYGIYHDSKTPTWKIFLYAYSGIFIPTFVGNILGAAFAAAAPAIPVWQAGLGDDDNFGRFLVAVLDPIGGFGKFLVVLAALTIIAPCALTMYSLGLSLMNISPIFTKVPRYIYMIIATAMRVHTNYPTQHTIPLAIVCATHFFTALESVLNLMGYWVASYTSIVLCEHFVFRRNDWSRYRSGDWKNAQNLPLGIAAVLSLLCSFGVIVPSIDQVWYTGPIAQVGTGDIGILTGSLGAGLAYLVLRSAERAFSARSHG